MIAKCIYIFSFVFILLASQLACGQSQNTSGNNQKVLSEKVDSRIDNLKKQASELYTSFDKNDFDKFAGLTHPKVIEKVGGREKLILMMKTMAEQNPKIFETFSTSIGNPSALVKADGQLFGIVPHKIEGTTFNKHKIVQEGCFVGVSTDSGKTWKFVGSEKFNDLFPSLKGKIQIPEEKTFVDGIEK